MPTRVNSSVVWGVVFMTSALSGCESITGCDLSIPAGLHVTVADAATGESLGASATGTAVGGDTTYTFVALPNSGALIADAFVGTYTVRIEVPGYTPYVRTGVRVRRDECSVQTTSLTARMTRAGSE